MLSMYGLWYVCKYMPVFFCFFLCVMGEVESCTIYEHLEFLSHAQLQLLLSFYTGELRLKV